MSFLLEGKPRRRNRLPNRSVAPRNRNFSKDAADNGTLMNSGGQVQIQRPRVPQQQQRVIPQQQQHQHDQHKQEAMQSAGISMEQVMEDLRVLEEQQHDSQRKLAQVKNIKQHRLDSRTLVESQLASIKYKNGEQRTQLNRAREVLSNSTRELEVVKLDANGKDERLKALDQKLKKALFKSREHQTYRRKIDSRLVNIRSKESVCHRLLCTLRDDVTAATKDLDDAKCSEQQLRQAIAEHNSKIKVVSEDTSKVRAEVSGLAEDLRAAQQMEAYTKLRAESIASETEAEDVRQAKDMSVMKLRLEAANIKKHALRSGREKMQLDLNLQYSKMNDLWKEVVVIQTEEGHDLSPEPTEGGDCPCLNVEQILNIVREDERQLDTLVNAAATLRNSCEEKIDLARQLEAENNAMMVESSEIRVAAKVVHSAELERTADHESFLNNLEREREEVAKLRTALIDLETGGEIERKRLEGKLDAHATAIADHGTSLEELNRKLAETNEAVVKCTALLETEKSECTTAVEQTKLEAEAAKVAFEAVKGEVEALSEFHDAELDQEIEEIERAQKIMSESTQATCARILKSNPELQQLTYLGDDNLTSEERIAGSLVDLKHACKERKDSLSEKQMQIMADVTQQREDEQRRLTEAAESERQAKQEAERERKENRRRAREEKRRKKAELDAAEAKRLAIEEADRLQRETAEKERASIMLDLAAAKAAKEKTTIEFSSAFEDEEVQSENEFDTHTTDLDDGCLTQRVGLDIPTPKSKDKMEQERTSTLQRQPSKVRWEGLKDDSSFGHVESGVVDATEKDLGDRKSRKIKGISKTSTTKGKHEKLKDRPKTYGSTVQKKKERERKEKEIRRNKRALSPSSTSSSRPKSKKPTESTLVSKLKSSHGTIRDLTAPTKKSRPSSSDAVVSSLAAAGDVPSWDDFGSGDKKKLSHSPKKLSSRPIKPNRDVPGHKTSSKTTTATKKNALVPKDTSKVSKRSAVNDAFAPARKKTKSSSSSESRPEKVPRPEKAPRPEKVLRTEKVPRSEKLSKNSSDRSVTSRKSTSSRKSVSSRKSTCSRIKKRANDEMSTQTSGISSGERGPSKSRRRKSKGTVESKSRSAGGVLGQVSDDFNFNF